MKIGVFDSGVGGMSVVNAVQYALPKAEILFKNDKANLPYGTKSKNELLALTAPIVNEFENEQVSAIVIACNTVSTTILAELKESSSVPVIGFVPMIKPAAQISKTNVITVCATPATLASSRYAELKSEFGADLTILEPDCSDWAELIEQNQLAEARINEVIQLSKTNNADVIVLGCTHYHWIEDQLNLLSGAGINVIQPTDAVIAELRRAIAY